MNDILFGNNNKAVIKKLANRSFRSNKMRNVIAVIAIALTTFLFTAVLTIGMGAKGTLEYNMAKMIGTGADALVQGLSEEQFQQLKENSMFEKVGCWVPIEIMTNTNRMVAEIDYADQPQLELRMQTPRTGSAPQKANEVLVSANILKDLNIEEKIGAEIPIEVAVTLGMTLLRAFVENGPTSMMMTFQITLLPALIMLVLFLVLAFIVPVVALRLLNNRSVVERLRVNE